MKKDYKIGDIVKCISQPNTIVNTNLIGETGRVLDNIEDGGDLNLFVLFSEEKNGDWYLDYENVEPA